MIQRHVSKSASTKNSSQRRIASPILVYYTKNDNGDYCCNICNIERQYRKHYISMETLGKVLLLYLKGSQAFRYYKTSNQLFSKKSEYLGRTRELTNERCTELIIKTNTAFATLENPEFEAFCSYFTQCDESLPSENTLGRGISTKFDGEKVKMRQLYRPIEKLSLTIDTWTTTNRVAILGTMIHYIDYMWNLHECVIAVKELCESH